MLPRATIFVRGSAVAYVVTFKPTRLGIFLVALFTYHGKKDQMADGACWPTKRVNKNKNKSGRQLQYNLSIVFLLPKHMNKDTSLIEFKAWNTLENC